MKNIYLSIALIFIGLCANAQDLAHRVPANARMVAAIRGKNILQLMSAKDISNTFAGKKVLQKLSDTTTNNFGSKTGPGRTYTNFEEFGIALNTSAYYYSVSNDSMSYNFFLVALNDAKRFDQLFANEKERIRMQGDLRIYTPGDSSSVVLWNNNTMLFAKGSTRSAYFDQAEVSKRYGLIELSSAAMVDTTAAVAADTVMAATVDTVMAAAPAAADSAYASTELSDYDKNQIILKKLGYTWTVAEALASFNKQDTKSILNNSSYLKSVNEKAEATLWISSIQGMWNDFYSTKNQSFKNPDVLPEYGSVNAQLFMEKEAIRITAGLELSKDLTSSYKRIMDRQLNKKFLKYINTDKAIGYMAYAVNTQAYLEEYPKMMAKILGTGRYGVGAEEAGLAADLFSLILDEAAIGKVIKGDALFVLNGVNQKEYKYKSFDYDADYNSKEVEKTGTESMPDFLMMVSTEDTRLLNKLITYGVHKNWLKLDDNFYEVSAPKSPTPFYLMIKDNIIFVGANKGEMQKIAHDTFDAKVSPEHKTLLTQHNFATYFSAKKLNSTKFGEQNAFGKTQKTWGNLGDIKFLSSKIENNIASMEMSMNIPNGHRNALEYLLSLIEDSSK